MPYIFCRILLVKHEKNQASNTKQKFSFFPVYYYSYCPGFIVKTQSLKPLITNCYFLVLSIIISMHGKESDNTTKFLTTIAIDA
jgi:hypothetical protein